MRFAAMDASGKLLWDAPALPGSASGEWTVIRFGHTFTGKLIHPSPQSGVGPECDKLSRRAIETHYNGMIGKLVKDEKLYQETAESMTNLKEILQKVNQGQGTVGKLVNDQEFYKNAKLTLQKVDKATEGLEDQGPLSVIGLLANSLF